MADTSCASSSAVGAEVVGESTAQQSSQMPGFISPVYGRLSSMNSQNASNANMSVMRTRILGRRGGRSPKDDKSASASCSS